MNNKIKLSHSFFFIVFFSFLFGSCVKENLVIPTIEPTYKIEDITIEGVQLKKITGTINESLNLKNTYQYLLSGLVYVEDSLTIQEGTIFYADNNVLTSLIVNRSAMIFANGTAQQPIIFTSENEIRQTAQPGDWGGIHINGQASLNSRKSGLVELIGKYGRTDIDANDLDNSGQLKYVRIEYGGRIMNGESGSLNLNGVGSNTSIEHIQVYKSLTSGIRFRGGAANLKYAISTQPEGRGFRWDDGWRGFGQFWIVHFPESMSDTVTAIEGRSGIVTDLPISSPIISNITVVGLGINSFSPVIRGIRFREATHGKIYNSIITNCIRGVRADYSQPYIDAGDLVFANNSVFNNFPNYYSSSSSVAEMFESPSFNNSSDFITMDGFKGTSSQNVFQISNLHSWFDNVTFKGALESANNWTDGWMKY